MINRAKAYTEVYTILQELNQEEYNKIPTEVLNAIKNNMDIEYEFELDEGLELKDQPMLPETKAILFCLFRDYLATKEQKQKVIKMQNEERGKLKLEQQQKYNSNVFENKEKVQTKIEEQDVTDLVKYKENIFKKIFNMFFKRI